MNFSNNRSLGLTFIRFQEYYEGPSHKGTVFTLKEYTDWYKKHRGKGKFTYCSEYTGYNLPDYAFNPFLEGKFNPLSKSEKTLLNAVKPLEKPFCIIGINPTGKYALTALHHELAHGLWYTNKEYRIAMTKLVKMIPKHILTLIQQELKQGGYHKDVYDDETQAYLTNDIGFFPDVSYPLVIKFRNTYKKYYDNLLITKKSI